MTDTEELEGMIVEVPCKIYTSRGTFNVPDVFAWQWIDQGVMAHGYWILRGEELDMRDVIFPMSRIDHIDLDFEALGRYHADQLTASLEQGGGNILPANGDGDDA